MRCNTRRKGGGRTFRVGFRKAVLDKLNAPSAPGAAWNAGGRPTLLAHAGRPMSWRTSAMARERAMLKDQDSSAIVAVSDIARAKAFYGETLGLEPINGSDEVLTFRTGRTKIVIYRSPDAGTNRANAVVWSCPESLDEIVAGLEAKGVAFERYPQMPGVVLRGAVHHMGHMRLVWLKDPDGNILHPQQPVARRPSRGSGAAKREVGAIGPAAVDGAGEGRPGQQASAIGVEVAELRARSHGSSRRRTARAPRRSRPG